MVGYGGTVKTTGGQIRSTSTRLGVYTVLAEGATMELINTNIIKESTSVENGTVVNAKQNDPAYVVVVIKNRTANYGVTGAIGRICGSNVTEKYMGALTLNF